MSDFIRKQQELAKKAMPQFGAVVHYLESKGQKLDAKTYERQQSQASSRLGIFGTTLYSNLTDLIKIKEQSPGIKGRIASGVLAALPPPQSTVSGPPLTSDFKGPWTAEHFKKHVAHLNKAMAELLDFNAILTYAKQKGVDPDLIYAIGRAENTWGSNKANNMGWITGNTDRNKGKKWTNRNGQVFLAFENMQESVLGLIDFLTLATPQTYPRTLAELKKRGGMFKYRPNGSKMVYCSGDTNTPGSYSANIADYCLAFRKPI